MVKIGDFYAYVLINPVNNEPFYVGKGKDKRIYQHIKYRENDKIHNLNKYNIIESAINANLKIPALIYRGKDQKEAKQMEHLLVVYYNGLLTNIGATSIHQKDCWFDFSIADLIYIN